MPTDPTGSLAKFGIGDSSPVDVGLRFVSENFAGTRTQLPDDEITGSASADLATVRFGPYSYAGSVVLRPTCNEWIELLPWMLGGTPSGNTYPLGDSIVEKYFSFDLVTKVLTWAGGVVGSWSITCNAQQKFSLQLDLFATGETVANAGTFPALTLDEDSKPFVLSDFGTITVNSVGICVPAITISGNNLLTADELTNCSTGPTAFIRSGPRDIRISFTPAFRSAYASLYPPSEDGWPVQIEGVNEVDGGTITFDFPAVVFDRISPSVASRAEKIRLPLNGKAWKSGNDLEMEVTVVPPA